MEIFLHLSVCLMGKLPRKRLDILFEYICNVFFQIFCVIEIFETLTIETLDYRGKAFYTDIIGYFLDNLTLVVHNNFYNILFHNSSV